jgi:hypothetical protein
MAGSTSRTQRCQLIGRDTSRGILDALVIALRPEVRTAEFVREQKRDRALTHAPTDQNGRFTFPQQSPRGHSYGLILVARSYRDMAFESALRISADAPEQARIHPVPMLKV